MPYSEQQLTPVCLQIVEKAKKELPPEIAERLTGSRSARVHGSYRTVLLFNVWDRYQSDVLPKQHFCYCLSYDPDQLISGGSDWYFHLWLNTKRLYRDRMAVKQQLEQGIAQACPKGFHFYTDDRSVQAKINFDWDKDLGQLVDFLAPKYTQLIEAMHPLLMPIIDRYSIYGRQDVKAEVAKRGRLPVKPFRTAHPELVEKYSRSVPRSWRPKILQDCDYKCAHCGTALSEDRFHVDHIVPYSKQGGRKGNLQASCPACNHKKGNRFTG